MALKRRPFVRHLGTAVLAAVGGIRGLSREGILAAFVDLVGESDDHALDNLEMLIAERRAQSGKNKA